MTEIQFPSYDTCCRTCMRESLPMYSIFNVTIKCINLADILMACTGLNIQADDALPKNICSYCYDCLTNYHQFCNLAQEVDTKLKEIILGNNENTQNISYDDVQDGMVEIKIEGCCEIKSEIFHPTVEVKEENRQILDENKNAHWNNNSITEESNCEDKKSKPKLKYTNKCKNCNRNVKKREHTFCEACTILINGQENVNKSVSSNNEQSTNGSFKCSTCLLTFKSVNSLSAHMRKHTPKGRVIICNECNKVFKKLSHLKRHEKIHGKSYPHQCSLCPKSFPTAINLNDHINKHNGVKPYECPMCRKAFTYLSSLKSHVTTHTKDRNYLCPTCGKKFQSSTNLNQHITRHKGLKNFACNLCPKKFISKGELKSHINSHTGERRHTCDECGRSFTKGSSLVKHKMRHLGVRPHQCDTCSMKFLSKDHLKRHYRIHTGEKPFRCEICERAFTQSNDLVKHRRGHLGDKLYKCNECGEGFRLQTELRRHVTQHFMSAQHEKD